MDFEMFKANLEVLDKVKGERLRDQYIEKFINIENELYQERIVNRHKFCDGYCYLGYLWDYLKSPCVISGDYIKTIAKSIDEVYVFWDIHSCERILIKNYWKYAKDAILRLNFSTLLIGQKYLPEDIYIFDDSFSWTLIKTHEDIDGKCYCLKSGKI